LQFRIIADPCVGAVLDHTNPNSVIVGSKPALSIYDYRIGCIMTNTHLYTDNNKWKKKKKKKKKKYISLLHEHQ
jgi:hypothetical protein